MKTTKNNVAAVVLTAIFCLFGASLKAQETQPSAERGYRVFWQNLETREEGNGTCFAITRIEARNLAAKYNTMANPDVVYGYRRCEPGAR